MIDLFNNKEVRTEIINVINIPQIISEVQFLKLGCSYTNLNIFDKFGENSKYNYLINQYDILKELIYDDSIVKRLDDYYEEIVIADCLR